MTEAECGKLMLIYSQYWNIRADDMRMKIRAYWHSLQDIDYIACQKAVIALSKTAKFPPTVAELREVAEPIMRASLPPSASGDWIRARTQRRLRLKR